MEPLISHTVQAHLPNGIPPGFEEPPPSPVEPDTPIELPHDPPAEVIEPPAPTEMPPVQDPPANPVEIKKRDGSSIKLQEVVHRKAGSWIL